MSLALATLVHEWRRYLAAVIALAFSGLLVLAQVGMFTGIVHAVTATIDRSRAQIVIMPPKRESLVENGPAALPARIAPQIYLNPEVAEVASFDGAGAPWLNIPGPGGKQVALNVAMRAVDPRLGAVTLPVDYGESVRVALMEPYAVAVDRTALGRLGARLGDRALLAGRTVRVAALLDGYADINQVSVVMSRDTMRMLGVGVRNETTGPLLVALKDPSRTLAVRDQLNAVSRGAYRAWTRQDLARANEGAMIKHQVIGLMLGFSLFLSLLIGVGVTSQTLRGAILSNVREFASLRALGVPLKALRLIVLELSLWVGVAGLALAAGFTFLVAQAGALSGLPMSFPVPWVACVAVLLLLIALGSGMMSMGVLRKAQPADLLR
ncbi:ABC transporter permease [Phenylobacterium sp.]|jgi:putative ABC transport system permease protein|uniref:ABC transporter permease n=1 Tax=Phenylobacterium sp. TaxID=1871053 RepID=UPI002F41F76D